MVESFVGGLDDRFRGGSGRLRVRQANAEGESDLGSAQLSAGPFKFFFRRRFLVSGGPDRKGPVRQSSARRFHHLGGVFHSADVWSKFNPSKITLASPDPQAIRSDPSAPGRLLCTLPSNFKAAPFEIADDQALLQSLASDMSHLEVAVGSGSVRPPVALVASSSLFVPLAKWPMLIAGNCRCVLPTGMRTIAEAVLDDIEASAEIYEQVRQLTLRLGAREQDLVKFQNYADTASRLVRPSSLARAIEAGVFNVERIDRLVQNLLAAQGLAGNLVDPVVALIDRRLAQNRTAPPPVS